VRADVGFRRAGQTSTDYFSGREKEGWEFRKHVKKQQALANGRTYSCALLLFYPQGDGSGRVQVKRLAESLSSRLRATDRMGWLDSRRFGVLLPYMQQAGAQHMAEELRHALLTIGEYMPVEVYVCPAEARIEEAKQEARGRCNGAGCDTQVGADPFLEDSKWLRTWAGTTWPEPVEEPAAAAETREAHPRSPMPSWKRVMDVILAGAGLVATLPVVILGAALIKCMSRGPVIYKQARVGYKGRMFIMWKLRTYKVGTCPDDHRQHLCNLITKKRGTHGQPMRKLDSHPGIIRFGNVLRKTCIDEIPQLINVLKGDMSLVGPRPGLPYEVELYSPWHRRRLDAIPGMTGLWQVSGKNRLTFDEMVSLDIQYRKELSWWKDLVILLKTPLAVVEQMLDYVGTKQSDPVDQVAASNIAEARSA
jgi:lipopolysaccharide/colanic/teichoic acid biosynthesis glycosyltransferase